MTSEPPHQPKQDDLPPQGMRTAINFLLFVHLFTVGMLMLLAGSSLGPPLHLSLRQQLRRIPGYYLQVLGMDMDFDSGQRYNLAMEFDEIEERFEQIADHLKYIDQDPARRHPAETALTYVTEQQDEPSNDPSRRGLMHLTHGGALDVSHFVELYYTANLFSVPLGPEELLNSRQVSDPLKMAFQRHKLPWPADAADVSVSVIDAGREWRIEAQSRTYVVRKSSDVLNIRENRVGQLPNDDFWPYQRYLRYQMLTREMARLSHVDSVKGILPAAVTSWMIRQREELSLDERLSDSQPRLVLRRRISQPEFEFRREQSGLSPNQLPPPEDAFWYSTTFIWTPRVVSGRVLFNEVEGNTRDYAPAVATKVPATGPSAKQQP